jgi:hypothetical protein
MRVRTSEKKRRERLGECFDALKTLLPPPKDRNTKEDILKDVHHF